MNREEQVAEVAQALEHFVQKIRLLDACDYQLLRTDRYHAEYDRHLAARNTARIELTATAHQLAETIVPREFADVMKQAGDQALLKAKKKEEETDRLFWGY